MATGDQSDLLARLKALLPNWFGGTSTLLTAALQGYAAAGAFVYALYAYAKLQTRISTATDGWLDMIAADYFGTGLIRPTGQSDTTYRARILSNLLRERATHAAIEKALTDLTGRLPRVVELGRAIDTSAYGCLVTGQRAGPAHFFGWDGVMRTAAANVQRYNFDPANLSAAPVQLNEAAATNLFVYPRHLRHSPWLLTSTLGNFFTAADASITAPDGTRAGVMKFVSTATTSQGLFLRQGGMSLSPGTYIISLFVYVPSGQSGVSNFSLVVDLSDADSAQSANSSTFDQWVRLDVTVVATAVRSFVDFNVRYNTTQVPSVAGFTLHVWRPQLVLGTLPTSIIPDATSFVSRAGPKWEFNESGVLTQYSNDVPVIAYDPVTHFRRGLSLELAVLNAIRNNTMAGAAISSTLPTNWSIFSTVTGLAIAVVAIGNEAGIDCIDLRISGTPSASGHYYVNFDTSTTQAASNGQTWTASVFTTMIAGSMAGILAMAECVSNRSTGGSAIVDSEAAFVPGTSNLAANRYSSTATFASSSTLFAASFIHIALSGTAVDITLRIGLPQLEQSEFASSPIKTSGSAVTRAADISTSPQGARAADLPPLISSTARCGIGGYGVRGAYRSVFPSAYQAFVTAYRPLAGSGYAATDADIFAAIEAVKPIGTVIWTAISD